MQYIVQKFAMTSVICGNIVLKLLVAIPVSRGANVDIVNTQRRLNEVAKREDNQNCSVLCCVLTVVHNDKHT